MLLQGFRVYALQTRPIPWRPSRPVVVESPLSTPSLFVETASAPPSSILASASASSQTLVAGVRSRPCAFLSPSASTCHCPVGSGAWLLSSSVVNPSTEHNYISFPIIRQGGILHIAHIFFIKYDISILKEIFHQKGRIRMEPDIIGKRLHLLRKMRKLNMIELEKLSGVAQSTISWVESGRRQGKNLTIQSVQRLAWALGVSVDVLAPLEDHEGHHELS